MGLRRVLGLAGVGLWLAVAPAAVAADWPSSGHDLANSRDGGTDGPSVDQARTLQPYWRFSSTEGDFTGTPAVVGGTVVVGTNGGAVDALDATTGRLLWSRTVGPQVNGSVAIAGGVVYVPVNIDETGPPASVGSPSLVALRLSDGTQLWQSRLDTQPGADVYGSPVVYRNAVYIGVSASYAEDNLPATADRGSVVALDAATGAQLWKTYTVPAGDDGGAVWSTAAIDTATGVLFVGTGNAYHAPAAATTDAILALQASTGTVVGHFQAHAGDVNTGGQGLDADFGASPNLLSSPSGQALVGEGDKAGTYWALDRASLAPVWHASVGPGGLLGGILGSTAWDGAAVYGPQTTPSATWSLSAAGVSRWTDADGGKYHLGPVSLANGVAYTTDQAGNLTARATVDGSVLARLPLGAASWGGVAIAGGTVFAVTGTQGASGSVVAFRPDCADDPSGAREIGPVSGLVHAIVVALYSAGQPGLGSTVHGVNCATVVNAGL